VVVLNTVLSAAALARDKDFVGNTVCVAWEF
jgi:hypothetical protein